MGVLRAPVAPPVGCCRRSAHAGAVVTLRNQPAPRGSGESEADQAGEASWWRQWAAGRGRLLVPVVVVAAVLAWLAGSLSGQVPPSGTRIGLIVVGAACTAVAAGLPLWQRRRANAARADAVAAARAARAQLRMALSDTLDPFAHLLVRLATARGAVKTQLRGEAIALAVAAVAGQAQRQRARVCFFMLERDPLRLRPDRFVGRAGAPTATFTAETPGGAGALGIAQGAGWLYVPDTVEQAPPCWIDDERGYRSLLVGPVTTPEGPVGMLTIDAPDPNALDGIDMALVRLLATLLAIALSM
jgi:hypothetical protein